MSWTTMHTNNHIYTWLAILSSSPCLVTHSGRIDVQGYRIASRIERGFLGIPVLIQHTYFPSTRASNRNFEILNQAPPHVVVNVYNNAVHPWKEVQHTCVRSKFVRRSWAAQNSLFVIQREQWVFKSTQMRSHQVINAFWQWSKESGNISIRTNIPCRHTIFLSCYSTSFHGLPDSTSAKCLPVPFHRLTRKLACKFFWVSEDALKCCNISTACRQN